MRRCPAFAALVPAVLFLVSLSEPSAAQTTSSISGRVTDESGAALPGATVDAQGPSLQGSRTAVTDTEGRYHLSFIPPGTYTVSFFLQGFAKETHKGVAVALGKDTALNAKLHVSATAEMTVSGEAAAMDPASTTIGSNLDIRTVTTLPTGRNYSSLTQVVPGVSSDANENNSSQATISVYGSSGAENVFYIDGVNTTGSEYGFQGKELNFEFIQAVDVKTGGYEAEFGRSTGGVVNVITKSGGNEFHGDVFGYWDSAGLQAEAKPVVSTTTSAGFTRSDFGLDLGGYIVKDRLWFFGAYDRVKNTQKNVLPEGPAKGQVAESESTRDLAAAKLTFKITPSHSVVFSFFQDPRDDTGAITDANHTLNGEPLTYQGLKGYGGSDFALRYEGLLGTKVLVTLQGAQHREKNNVGPATSAGDVIQYQDAQNNFFQTGGFGRIEEKSFTRNMITFSTSAYLGNHEVKFGFEYEHEKAEVMKRMSGGQLVTVFANEVHPTLPIYSHNYWTTPNATVANAPVSQLVANPAHNVTTLYLQDRWTILPNLTLSAGLRWDRQQIIDASGVTQIDLKNDFAPRVGVSWDPTKDQRTKVFGSYGRYYEQLPMDLVIRSFSYERQPNIVNYSPTSTTPNAAAESDLDKASNILGGFTEPSDPNLRNQYITEFILGAEREVVRNVVVGLKGVYRSYGQVVEDFLCIDDGTYCIGNPGRGIMERLWTYDYSQTYPSPKAERTYRALQVDVTKTFSDNWYAQASYIYSKLKGNFDGLYAPFTNAGADPNISAAFDYYDFFTDGKNLNRITNTGPLSNDRASQFKLTGYYVFPFGLSVGAAAYYRTGTPVTRYGYSDGYSRYEFFLTERGAEGRTPANYDLDIHLGYPIPLGPVKVNLLVDVFNLFNAQRPILLDQRWGFQEGDNFSPTPVNPGYLQPVLRTPPTTVRFGVRVSL